MEHLVEIGRAFVKAMRDRRGIANVVEMYAENAESVEAVVPPGRDVRIAQSRAAIKGKGRTGWQRMKSKSSMWTAPMSIPPTVSGCASRQR